MTNGQHTSALSKLRRLFSWRVIRRLAVAAILIALFYAEENWRGKHAWKKYKREWEAKGERFDREAFIPPPVPDEQNFAAIPLFTTMFDYQYDPARKADWMFLTGGAKWRDHAAYARTQQLSIYKPGDAETPSPGQWQAGKVCDLKAWQTYYRGITNFPVAGAPQDPAHDVLLALTKYDDFLNEIRAASVRTNARFPIHYDEDRAAMLPHLNTLRSLSRILSLRALAELKLDSSDQAFADINLGFRLIESLKSEPMFISQLVRVAMVNMLVQPLWEGFVTHRWTDEQLQSFQAQLMAVNFLAGSEHCMRAERAEMNSTISDLRLGTLSAHNFMLRYMIIDTLGSIEDAIKPPLPGQRSLESYLRLCPSGWLYLDQIRVNRFCQETILPLVDVREERVFPAQAQRVEEMRRHVSLSDNPNRIIVGLLESGLPASYRFAMGQTTVNEALIACALERYRIVHKEYPTTLHDLAPEFTTKLPHDVVNGQTLSYQPTSDGRFTLSSAGWNDPSLGRPLKSGTHSWDSTGDWTWRFPVSDPQSN